MQQIQALDFSGAFVFRLQQMQQFSRVGAVVGLVADAVDGALRSCRGRSCPAAVGVLWAFTLLPFFRAFSGRLRRWRCVCSGVAFRALLCRYF
jgi:hypothetical protein